MAFFFAQNLIVTKKYVIFVSNYCWHRWNASTPEYTNESIICNKRFPLREKYHVW